MGKFFKKLFFLIPFLVFALCGITKALEPEENTVIEDAPKLSIVMPVYNVAPYLDEALDSVENQTFEDLEIICVNDGSTDNSLQILEEHAMKDERIKIINQENQGVSEARNVGLRAATGEYIYFFDSDDVLAPYAMEKAIGNLDEHNADALEFGYAKRMYDEEVDFSVYPYDDSKIQVFEYKPGDNPFDVFEGSILVWARVYRRSFLNEHSICFNKNIKMSEDVLFSLICRTYMKKLVKYNNICYWYRTKRPGSALFNNPENTRHHIGSHIMIIRELIRFRNNPDINRENIDEYLLSYLLYFVCGRWGNVAKMADLSDRQQFSKMAYEEIEKNFVEKYKVKVSPANKKRLDALKRLFEIKAENKKIKKSVAPKVKKRVIPSKAKKRVVPVKRNGRRRF